MFITNFICIPEFIFKSLHRKLNKMEFQKIMGVVFIAWLMILITASEAEKGYQRAARDRSNQYRKRHCAPKLTSSDDLNNRAIHCARYYAKKGTIDHSCPYKDGVGENLQIRWGGRPSDHDVAIGSTDAFYSEVSKHDYNKDWQPESGHFSALVWKASRKFGFGVARSGDTVVGVALYYPHGNIQGRFKDNVHRPHC